MFKYCKMANLKITKIKCACHKYRPYSFSNIDQINARFSIHNKRQLARMKTADIINFEPESICAKKKMFKVKKDLHLLRRTISSILWLFSISLNIGFKFSMLL